MLGLQLSFKDFFVGTIKEQLREPLFFSNSITRFAVLYYLLQSSNEKYRQAYSTPSSSPDNQWTWNTPGRQPENDNL